MVFGCGTLYEWAHFIISYWIYRSSLVSSSRRASQCMLAFRLFLSIVGTVGFIASKLLLLQDLNYIIAKHCALK